MLGLVWGGEKTILNANKHLCQNWGPMIETGNSDENLMLNTQLSPVRQIHIIGFG